MKKARKPTLSFLKSVVEALPCLVSYVDKNLIYRYANETYLRWYKVDHRKIAGQKVAKFMGERAFNACEPYMRRALSGENIKFRMETVGIGGDETRRTVLVNYNPDVAPSGEIRGFFSIVTDITNELEAASALRYQEREIKRIFNAVPSLIARWDAKEANLNANTAYAGFFNLTPEQMVGRTMSEVFAPDHYRKTKPYIDAVLRGIPQQFERIVPKPNGVHRIVLVNFLPDFAQDGTIAGYFVVANDVTELKESEERRRKLELSMIASSKMAELGEMAGGIAHEINSPLTTILTSIDMLREICATHPIDDKSVEQYIGLIENTTERIAKIIRGLRNFSRNAENDPMTECLLSTIIDNTAELCRERLKAHQIELSIKCDPNLRLQCREAQISQILLNLISNSLDAIDRLPQKWIRIEAEGTKDMIQIRVVDSGPGIPESIAAKIMQPFYTTKEIGKGTGLGLSVSFGLAEAHNGKLFYVDGQKNTTFCLAIPRHGPLIASIRPRS